MNLLTRKLEGFAALTDDDRQLLDQIVQPARVVPAHTDLVREGERPRDVFLILEGFACRYKLTSDGRRHIMAYMVPGDFCDLHTFVLKEMDHSVATLSQCQVVSIPHGRILEMMRSPTLSQALWFTTMVDTATLREWLVNLGQREADERVGHLLCELLLRLQAVGLVDGATYELPITQTELGDTMGISSVHINRVLQRLRKAKLITWKRDALVILDVKRLFEFSGFESNYLHLNESSRGASQIA